MHRYLCVVCDCVRCPSIVTTTSASNVDVLFPTVVRPCQGNSVSQGCADMSTTPPSTRMPPLATRTAFGTPQHAPSLAVPPQLSGSQTDRGPSVRSNASLPYSVQLPSRIRPASGAAAGSLASHAGPSSLPRSRRNLGGPGSQATLFRVEPVPVLYAAEVSASMEVVKVTTFLCFALGWCGGVAQCALATSILRPYTRLLYA